MTCIFTNNAILCSPMLRTILKQATPFLSSCCTQENYRHINISHHLNVLSYVPRVLFETGILLEYIFFVKRTFCIHENVQFCSISLSAI